MSGSSQSPTDAPQATPESERPAGHLPADDAPGTRSQRSLIGAPKLVEDAMEAAQISAEEHDQVNKTGIECQPVSGEDLALGRDRSDVAT